VDRMTSCVSVSLDIGILRWCGVIAVTATAPPRPCSRRGRIPEGVSRAQNGHSTALFAYECQSFLDNVIAQLGCVLEHGMIGQMVHTIAASPLSAKGPHLHCSKLQSIRSHRWRGSAGFPDRHDARTALTARGRCYRLARTLGLNRRTR